jgi:predicted transcriptional regulator
MSVWKNDYINTKSKRNSINQIIDVLKWKQFLTENEIMFTAFGYDRNYSRASNKKYADMLRRSMVKGVIGRVEMKRPGSRAKYLYYLKENEAGIVRHIRSSYIGV